MFWKRRIYLDYAAGVGGNPSSPHEEGRRAKKMLEDARTSIARLVEVQSDDVIFTSGATESNALAILGLVKSGDHALYLPSAHASVVENMQLLKGSGVEVEELPVKDYRVDIEALKKMLRKGTVLVSMDAVCGETGVIWNTREVAHAVSQFSARSGQGRAKPAEETSVTPRAFLHVDASQAPLTEKLTRAHFGADLLTLDASKVSAVRGIGALIAHRTIPLAPLYGGGGQERGLRAGSEAPTQAREFASALHAAALGRESFRASAGRSRAMLIEGITKNIQDIYIHQSRSQAPHILNFSLVGRDTDYLVALLDEAGFAVSTRSACETDSIDGSRAVYALTGDSAQARSTLRVSWGPSVSSRDLSAFARALTNAVTAFPAGGGSASGGIDNYSRG